MATAAIAIGQQALSTISGLFAQHEIRARNAQNENQAAAQIVPQWDSYFQAIIHAYNSGEATPDQCIQALEHMDAQTEAELHQFVGKPGTSWTEYNNGRCGGAAQAHCNKQCTVGCCIFFTYLHPAAWCAATKIQAGKRDTVGRGHLFASKYGFPDMPGYTLDLIPPTVNPVTGISSVFESAATALGFGGGSGQVNIGGGYSQPGALSSAIAPGKNYEKWILIGAGALLLIALAKGSK